MNKFKLPENYKSRENVNYFDDVEYHEKNIIHQPEVYYAADYFIRADRRTTVIDIGCGNGKKLKNIKAERSIGIDFGPNIAFCRERYGSWGEWLEADFSTKDCIQLASLADNQTVVICADVIEHLVDPHHLIELLIACYHRGAIILTSTPDRIRVRGVDHLGPPPNPSHIREWALREYNRYLEENSLPVTFSGYTINNNIDEDLKTIITIHDKNINSSDKKITKKPVAIISCYNEADIIKEITEAWIHENCDIVFMDNWSTDETWNSLLSLKEKYPNSIKMERFPENNKNKKFE